MRKVERGIREATNTFHSKRQTEDGRRNANGEKKGSQVMKAGQIHQY